MNKEAEADIESCVLFYQALTRKGTPDELAMALTEIWYEHRCQRRLMCERSAVTMARDGFVTEGRN